MTKSLASTHASLFGWEDRSSEQRKLEFHPPAKISRALEQCAKYHRRSCRVSTEAPPPTRLLDVGLTSGEVRLVETELLHTPVQKYNCLSHCWGTQQPLETTRENYLQHLTSIAWDSIPKTFQDAIQLTRDLGVQFLWIDSLCIIQHDEEDWGRESAKMCTVYGNTYLTIAATSSSDCHGGLQYWKNRELFKVIGFTVNKTPLSISLIALPTAGRCKEDTPLLYRGWALQERMMSPRVVHFLPAGVALECNRGRLAEFVASRLNSESISKRSYHESIMKSSLWRDLIRTYCQSAVSYPSDKFPAISGLVQHIAPHRVGARYLAGLWSDSLILDLLWKREHRADYCTGTKGVKPWRAPSWSWAAGDGEIRFLTETLRSDHPQDCPQLFTLHDVLVAPATTDPSGKLSTASITVTGQLANASKDLFAKLEPFKVPDNVALLMHTVKVVSTAYMDLHFSSDKTLDQYFASNQIKSFRVTRNSFKKGKRHYEYALLLKRIGSSTDYVRVGIATEYRNWVADHRYYGPLPELELEDAPLSNYNTWNFRPSVFETGAVEETIRIV